MMQLHNLQRQLHRRPKLNISFQHSHIALLLRPTLSYQIFALPLRIERSHNSITLTHYQSNIKFIALNYFSHQDHKISSDIVEVMPVLPKVDCCHDGSYAAKDDSYYSARVEAIRYQRVSLVAR